jgi:hypothetical protein
MSGQESSSTLTRVFKDQLNGRHMPQRGSNRSGAMDHRGGTSTFPLFSELSAVVSEGIKSLKVSII